MPTYSFFYDEAEHSRKINYKTISAANYYDNFVTMIVGWPDDKNDILQRQINNDIVGFISDNSVVVGSLDSTRIVNVVNRSINSVDIPDFPNVCVKGAGYGKLIYTTYQDGSSTSTAYINDLDSETGKLREITSVRGYLDGTPSFSMSGAKLAISYGENADIGMNDIKIVDALNGTAISLNETTQVGQSVQAATNSAVRGFWLNEDTMLISHEETVSLI